MKRMLICLLLALLIVPEALAAPMRTVEAEEYLLDCVQRAGDFPLRAVRRLLCGGGISSA